MISKEHTHKVLKRVMKLSNADTTEVWMFGGKNSLTRWANNYIHQNLLQKDYTLMIKVNYSNRIGIATCNQFDEESINDALLRAKTISDFVDPDPDILPLLSTSDYVENLDSYHKETSKYDPEERALKVKSAVDQIKKENLNSAGTLSTGDSMIGIMNSAGLFAYHCDTHADFTLTVMDDKDGSAWVEHHDSDIAQIDVESLTKKALERAKLNIDPVDLEPGKYDVILEAPAVNSMVLFLAWLGFAGLSYQEGTSCFTGKLDSEVTGKNVTIIDNPFLPECRGCPFDLEGMAKKPLTMIEKGVAKNVALDRKTGIKLHAESTGHTGMPTDTDGPIPTNLYFQPGKSNVEEMIASTKKGILVTRFWYENVVDPKVPIITGMTRDGTFLVENGKITRPIRNIRFNESILGAFSRIEKVGDKIETFNEYGFSIGVPALKIKDFRFTS